MPSDRARTWLDDNLDESPDQILISPCCNRPVSPDQLHVISGVLPDDVMSKIRRSPTATVKWTKQKRQQRERRALKAQVEERLIPVSQEEYLCDGCRSRLIAEGHINKIEYLRLHGVSIQIRREVQERLNADTASTGNPQNMRRVRK